MTNGSMNRGIGLALRLPFDSSSSLYSPSAGKFTWIFRALSFLGET